MLGTMGVEVMLGTIGRGAHPWELSGAAGTKLNSERKVAAPKDRLRNMQQYGDQVRKRRRRQPDLAAWQRGAAKSSRMRPLTAPLPRDSSCSPTPSGLQGPLCLHLCKLGVVMGGV